MFFNNAEQGHIFAGLQSACNHSWSYHRLQVMDTVVTPHPPTLHFQCNTLPNHIWQTQIYPYWEVQKKETKLRTIKYMPQQSIYNFSCMKIRHNKSEQFVAFSFALCYCTAELQYQLHISSQKSALISFSGALDLRRPFRSSELCSIDKRALAVKEARLGALV